MQFSREWLSAIAEVSEAEWNALLDDQTSPCHAWGWINSMEASGSIAPDSGWYPHHLIIRDTDGVICAAAPLYVKTASHGEYVYDYAWADVSERLGIDYYPKLVATIPATPSASYQFLVSATHERSELCEYILDALEELVKTESYASLNFLFVDQSLQALLKRRGFAAWNHHRYVWRNRQYSDFAAFLADFGKNQRRNIRRERESITDQGLECGISRMSDLSDQERPRLAERMWNFYLSTNSQFGPWAARFLNRDFFLRAIDDCRDSLLFAWARKPENPDEPVAMALLFHNARQLYGRFWGADEFFPDLHFELCYYLPIEWCIQNGIELYDPGAGSPHKMRRGFVVEQTDSFHRFSDSKLNSVFRMYIPEINKQELAQIVSLNGESPLRFLILKAELAAD